MSCGFEIQRCFEIHLQKPRGLKFREVTVEMLREVYIYKDPKAWRSRQICRCRGVETHRSKDGGLEVLSLEIQAGLEI